MAKQPKPDDAAKETRAETMPAQTGKTVPTGTETVTASTVGDIGTPPDLMSVPISETIRAAVSETINAALDAGKSPEGRIMVIGPKAGRWRAGRHFGPEPTLIDVADLTEEEARALINDPKLVVGPAFASGGMVHGPGPGIPS